MSRKQSKQFLLILFVIILSCSPHSTNPHDLRSVALPTAILTNITTNIANDVANQRYHISLSLLSNLLDGSKSTCGRPIRSQTWRIVNGKPASVRRFPWMISLQRSKTNWFGYKSYFHSCGGSLISPSWIVTAGHCVLEDDVDFDIRAVAGTDNLRRLVHAQVRRVTKIITHSKFDRKIFDNDIALMKVNIPFDISANRGNVNTICLDSDMQLEAYDIATVCGFGAKAFKQDVQTHLLKTDIAIVDHDFCNEVFDHSITDNMLCAGGMVESKRDACTGDSGGPLMMEMDGRWTLAGIVSFGNDCARKNFPGIYTKVSNYYDWIYKNID